MCADFEIQVFSCGLWKFFGVGFVFVDVKVNVCHDSFLGSYHKGWEANKWDSQ